MTQTIREQRRENFLGLLEQLRTNPPRCGRAAARHRLLNRRVVQTRNVPEFKSGAHVGARAIDAQKGKEEEVTVARGQIPIDAE
jgi:hypothetical protein